MALLDCMAGHESTLFQEAERIRKELKQYFVHSTIDCPYGLPFQAIYNQALFDTVPDFIMEAYLAYGYRRNGNVIYNMHCSQCNACEPIRIAPQEFIPNRNQRRVEKKNHDVTVEVNPLSCSEENLALLEKFLAARYPGRDSSPLDYYNGFFLNHITNTVEFSYWIGRRLLGVAIVDLSTAWLNVVFNYFDPDEKKRSPGTLNILHLIDFSRRKNIKFVYLGYSIQNVSSMSYKANFKPHYLLRDNTWQLVSR